MASSPIDNYVDRSHNPATLTRQGRKAPRSKRFSAPDAGCVRLQKLQHLPFAFGSQILVGLQENMTLVLRPYEPADLHAVWALHQLASQVAGVPTPEPYFSDLHDVESAFLNSGGEFVVGEYQGHLVAMGGVKRTAGDRAEIARMRVHPNFQRQGFGSALLRHLEKRATELGYRTLHLDTLVVQEAAQQFYLRHGYRCVGSGHKEAFAVVFFEKRLAFNQPEA